MAAATGLFDRVSRVPVISRYKPNRSHPRPFSNTDAARVICYAIRSGLGSGKLAASANFEAELQNINNLARARCGEGPIREASAAEIALAKTASYEDSSLQGAFDQLAQNSALFLQLLEWFGALLTFLTILIAIARVVPFPQIRLVAAGASRILTRVTAFQGAIVARRAANDAQMQTIQRILEIRKAA